MMASLCRLRSTLAWASVLALVATGGSIGYCYLSGHQTLVSLLSNPMVSLPCGMALLVGLGLLALCALPRMTVLFMWLVLRHRFRASKTRRLTG